MSGIFKNEYPYTDFHELNLSWVIQKTKETIDRIKNIEEWKEEYQEVVDNLEEFYANLIQGNYPPEFIEHLERWIGAFGVEIIAQKIKSVFFYLDQNGYFMAYIPESWDEITFGTSGLDTFPAGVDYGHLTLTY